MKGPAPAPRGFLSLELLGAAPALSWVGESMEGVGKRLATSCDSDSLSQARPLPGD